MALHYIMPLGAKLGDLKKLLGAFGLKIRSPCFILRGDVTDRRSVASSLHPQPTNVFEVKMGSTFLGHAVINF